MFCFSEEEGKDLLSKRTMDFKVSYLDAGFATSYFDSDCGGSSAGSGGGSGGGPKLNHRRYKTQLRDFLSSCRTKRKPLVAANDIYADTGGFAAYPTAASMYTAGGVGGPGSIPGYPADTTTLYMQQNLAAAAASPAAYQSLYPGVDNRYLATATDYFTAATAGYRSLAGGYYPDYAAHAALGNGYHHLDTASAGRIHSLTASYHDQKLAEADKLYGGAYAAASLSDPRLCGSAAALRLPATADNKNGKDHGKLVVKEEGGLSEYSLHHANHHGLDGSGGGGGPPAYTLPEQIQAPPPPVLYMCPPPDSPKLTGGYDPRVHSPSSLRLASNSSPAGGADSPARPVVASGEQQPTDVASSGGTAISCHSPSVLSSSCCTFSLSDICGVAAISTESVQAAQEVQTAHTQSQSLTGTVNHSHCTQYLFVRTSKCG